MVLIASSCDDHCSNYEQIVLKQDKPVYLHCQIVAKYRDSAYNQKDHVTLLMGDGFRYHVNIRGIWGTVEVGDSIIKDKGSLNCIIIRKNTHDSDRYYTECDGYEIK